jgi:type III secretion protein U
MKDNDSEQRSLPASEKKLRDSRKKGQVSSSRDLISGFGLLAMIIYLLLAWPTLRDHMLAFIDLVSRLHEAPFEEASRQALAVASRIVWLTLGPAIAVLIGVSVAVGMAGTFGPVFAFDPVKPNFEHINPAAGLKRIFSIRNGVEFLKTLVKVIALGAVLYFVLRGWLQAMFHAPNCGEHCIVPLLIAALKPIVAVAALAFIVIGVLDIGVQRWLFLRDMRMTKTEQKRERKDLEGDPLILGERKRQRQVQGRAPSRLGVPASSLVIAGNGQIAALRYHRIKAPVPIIVARSRGSAAEAMRETAISLGIPIVEDGALAGDLVQKHAPGDFLRQEYFPAVAAMLVQNKLT